MAIPGRNSVSIDAEPLCAICEAPPAHNCGCEAQAFQVAISQAEDRYFKPTCLDLRAWVSRQAREYILAYFYIIKGPCKAAYLLHLETIQATCAQYNTAPTPDHYAQAKAELNKNINRAWRLAVRRYPVVLDYFYSLIHVTIPDDPGPSRDGTPMHHQFADLRHAEHRRVVPREEAPAPKFPMPTVSPPADPACPGQACPGPMGGVQFPVTPPPTPPFGHCEPSL